MAKSGKCILPAARAFTVPRYRISLVQEAAVAYRPQKSHSCAEDFYRLLRPLFAGLDREQFVVCCLDTKHRPIGVNVVAIGTLTETLVHPREVFKLAIAQNAKAILLSHNHVSGDPAPSWEDRIITKRLKKCGQLLGIEVLDHVIVGEKSFASLDEDGRWTTEMI